MFDLAQLLSAAHGSPMSMQDQPDSQEYQPGDIPRQLIDLTHQAIAMEPDPADKSLLGKILSMLLQYQQTQVAQGQSK